MHTPILEALLQAVTNLFDEDTISLRHGFAVIESTGLPNKVNHRLNCFVCRK
jgi:hypothetical protein